MTWGAIAGAGIGLVGSQLLGGSSPSGGGASGGGPQYVPTGLGNVDQSWQNYFGDIGSLAGTGTGGAGPGFQQSLQQGENINYGPYQQYANQSGQQYAQAGNLAQQQMGQYGQQAQGALQQQQQLYGYGNQIAQTAFDPQNALYQQTAQQVTDQTRAGQAARGLGNSPEGSMEEANALSNFNINWQNNQLGRQTQGASAIQGLNQGGIAQGNLYGNDQQAALAAGAAGAGYYGQAGQVPLQAQQYAAAQPGAIAGTYAGQIGALQGLYSSATQGAIPYLNNGQGAQQGNYANLNAQNQALTSGLTQLGSSLAPKIGNYFNSGGSGSTGYGGSINPYDSSANGGYAGPSDYNLSAW